MKTKLSLALSLFLLILFSCKKDEIKEYTKISDKNNTTVTTNDTSEVVVADNVRIMDDYQLLSSDEEMALGIYRYKLRTQTRSGDVFELNEGDVIDRDLIVGSVGEGYYKRVLESSVRDDEMVIRVDPDEVPKFEELFRRAKFTLEGDWEEGGILDGISRGKRNLEHDNDSVTAELREDIDGGLRLNFKDVRVENELFYVKSVDNSHFGFKPTLRFKFDGGFRRGVKELEFGMKVEEELVMDVEYWAVRNLKAKFDLMPIIKLKKKVFFVGGVPIVITPTIRLLFIADGQLGGIRSHAAFRHDGMAEGGLKYERGVGTSGYFNTEVHNEYLGGDQLDVQAGRIRLRARVMLEYMPAVYGIAGPFVTTGIVNENITDVDFGDGNGSVFSRVRVDLETGFKLGRALTGRSRFLDYLDPRAFYRHEFPAFWSKDAPHHIQVDIGNDWIESNGKRYKQVTVYVMDSDNGMLGTRPGPPHYKVSRFAYSLFGGVKVHVNDGGSEELLNIDEYGKAQYLWDGTKDLEVFMLRADEAVEDGQVTLYEGTDWSLGNPANNSIWGRPFELHKTISAIVDEEEDPIFTNDPVDNPYEEESGNTTSDDEDVPVKSGRIWNIKGPNKGAFDLINGVEKSSSSSDLDKHLINTTTQSGSFENGFTSGNNSGFMKMNYLVNSFKSWGDVHMVYDGTTDPTVSNVQKDDTYIVLLGNTNGAGNSYAVIEITDVVDTPNDNKDYIEFNYKVFEY